MSSGEDVIGLEVVAKLDKFEEQFAAIPGIAADEARLAAAAIEKEFRRATAATDKLRKTQVAATKARAKSEADATRAISETFGALERGSSAVFGGIVGDVADVQSALAALGPGGAAVAVTALAAVGGAIGAIGASVDAIRTIEETRERLTELGAASTLTADQLQSIGEAQTALDAIEVSSLRAKEALAATSAQGVELLSGELLRLTEGPLTSAAEMIGRWVSSLGYGIATTSAFVDVMREQIDAAYVLKTALTGGVYALVQVLDATDAAVPRAVENAAAAREMAAAYEEVDVAAEAAARSVDDWQKSAAAALKAQREEMDMLIALGVVVDSEKEDSDRAAAAKDRKAAATREAAEADRVAAQQAQALSTIQAQLTQATIAAADPMHQVTLRLLEQVAEYDRLVDAAGASAEAVAAAEQAKVVAVGAAEQAIADLRQRSLNEAAATIARQVEQARAQAADNAAAWRDAAWTTTGAIASIGTLAADSAAASAANALAALEATGDASAQELAAAREAAESRAKWAKGAAVLETTVNAAAAITKAATAAPPPFNAPGIVAMTALGITQVAAAASAPLPVFHAGGLIRAPDEVDIRARVGEGVLTAKGVAAIGGAGGLAAANRGEAPTSVSTTIAVPLQLRHRTLDVAVSETITRGGRLATTVRGRERVGRSGRKR